MKFKGIDDLYFHLAAEFCPTAMVMVDIEGAIRFVNAEFERLFDYSNGELIGRSIDLLVPASFRDNHASLRRSFAANPGKRPMGAVGGLKGTRRDGTDLDLEIELIPLGSGPTLILAVVADVSGRRCGRMRARSPRGRIGMR